MVTLIIIIIAVAFLFDVINRYHDVANSVVTVLSTQKVNTILHTSDTG